MGSGKGAGTGCLKILLIFFNILFWVSNFQKLGFCHNTVHSMRQSREITQFCVMNLKSLFTFRAWQVGRIFS